MGHSQRSAGLTCTGLKQEHFWGARVSLARLSGLSSRCGCRGSAELAPSSPSTGWALATAPQRRARPGCAHGGELLLQLLPAQPLPCPAQAAEGSDPVPWVTCWGVSVPLLLGTARQELPGC